MGSLSIWHWIVVAIVILLLFGGRGKISQLMGDFAQGIKAFKKGMAEDDKTAAQEPAKTEPKPIDHQAASTAAKPADSVKQHS
ncbi:MAG TPA: twin-arginine translocase TatA/TatE family subunit [Xanthobacteraceae bacterium]|jgi:sec-independent protein translocase protein TatA|nr:twin-arginine translocase TatA/TatE family subunit [Xanthobacteraceae bacterium]